MHTSRWPISKLPIAHLKPFPYHKGEMYVELLDRLAKYVTDQLHPNLRETVEHMVEELEQILALQHGKYVEGIQDFQRIHDAFMTDVNSALMALNDNAVSDLASDPGTTFGATLRDLFADRSQLNDLEQRINTELRYSNALVHGVIGDGETDDSDALEQAIDDARNHGRVLALPRGGKIVLTHPVDISGVDIEGNNAEITIHTPFDGYALFSTGSINQRVTNLSVVLDARCAAPVQNMMLFDYVENLVLDNVNIRSTTPGANSSNHGVFGNDYAALTITNSKKTTITNLTTQNFENHVRLNTNTLMTFQNITIDTYRLGVWIRDVKQAVFNNMEIFGTSPHAAKAPGENGVLIEATQHGAVNGITLSDVFVRDAGEHGYRIGGNRQVRNVTYNDCTAHTVGACGFKTLGDSTTEGDEGNRHTGITYNRCTVIDGGLAEVNHNGFDVVLADNVNIIHPVIRRENTSYSTSNGVYLAGANDVTITNPLFEHFMYSGIRFEMATRFRELQDITVDGGTFRVVDGHTVDRQGIIVSAQRAPAAGSRFSNIAVKNNPTFDLISGVYAYTVMVDSAASATGVRLFTGILQYGVQPLHPDSELTSRFRFQLIGSRTQMSDDLPIGSTWYDTELGQQNPLYIRRNAGWEQIV